MCRSTMSGSNRCSISLKYPLTRMSELVIRWGWVGSELFLLMTAVFCLWTSNDHTSTTVVLEF